MTKGERKQVANLMAGQTKEQLALRLMRATHMADAYRDSNTHLSRRLHEINDEWRGRHSDMQKKAMDAIKGRDEAVDARYRHEKAYNELSSEVTGLRARLEQKERDYIERTTTLHSTLDDNDSLFRVLLRVGSTLD